MEKIEYIIVRKNRNSENDFRNIKNPIEFKSFHWLRFLSRVFLFILMKYKQEFESELNLMLADPKIMGKYSEQQITETLFEYWSMKDFNLPDLHDKEVYSDTNNFLNESKQLSKTEQKTLVNLLYKKYKYLTNGKTL